MGVYDTVYAKCIHCGGYTEEQIKPGMMQYYDLDAPDTIQLVDVIGKWELYCGTCKKNTIVNVKVSGIIVEKSAT
jgi:hypothetical protein